MDSAIKKLCHVYETLSLTTGAVLWHFVRHMMMARLMAGEVCTLAPGRMAWRWSIASLAAMPRTYSGRCGGAGNEPEDR